MVNLKKDEIKSKAKDLLETKGREPEKARAIPTESAKEEHQEKQSDKEARKQAEAYNKDAESKAETAGTV
jgi:hypothetical protein